MSATKSWVWDHFAKDEKDRSKVTCLRCKANNRDYQLSFHNSTSTLINHLKHLHKIEQQGPKGKFACTNPITRPIFMCPQDKQRSARTAQWRPLPRNKPVCIPQADPHPLEYWHEMAIHMPLLAKVAVAIHSVMHSEACVERSFSQQGLLHSDLRSRLSDKSIKSLMTVRMNIVRLYDVPAMPRQKRQRVQ